MIGYFETGYCWTVCDVEHIMKLAVSKIHEQKIIQKREMHFNKQDDNIIISIQYNLHVQ